MLRFLASTPCFYRYEIIDGNGEGKPSKNVLKIQGRLVRSRVNDPASPSCTTPSPQLQ